MARGLVELVIAPPLRPGTVLKLQRWLVEVAKAAISRVTPSWDGDTVLEMTIDLQPTPLVQMLTEAPEVEQVSEEPLTDPPVKGGEISYHVGGVKLYHSSRLDPRCCCS